MWNENPEYDSEVRGLNNATKKWGQVSLNVQVRTPLFNQAFNTSNPRASSQQKQKEKRT
jgi:hypothetical protein